MDLQTGLICVGVVCLSAAVILFVSMFGMKEKSYEEAIAEQRKLPDDLLLGKKDKGKEKKYKNKTGKKVKEKKEDKDEKDDKSEHVQFEETPQILSSDLPPQEVCKANKKKNKPEKVKPILVNKDESPLVIADINSVPQIMDDVNHFEITHPKDVVELIRSHSGDNLPQSSSSQSSDSPVNKTPKETPTKSKKNTSKDSLKKKDDNNKDDKKDLVNAIIPALQIAKETAVKEIQKDISAQQSSSLNKESKKNKKKNDILAQIGGDKDGVNVSLLMPLVQKAELSRSEIQILIDQLLNKQLDNPVEHSEWTEGRADPVIKLKKQLAEKDKALSEEHETSISYQNKLKELRGELNSEKSRLTNHIKNLEDALNNKITEAQTLHTRMQHILETHAAEKQGFSRQIEQLQSKVNEDAAIIHKMQEEQGQTQSNLQQEIISQRKHMEMQYSQLRENENGIKLQYAQQCEINNNEIERLRQQVLSLQEQIVIRDKELQVYKESSNRIADMSCQIEESHRANAELEHRLNESHRHEQELQKQLNTLQSELKIAKTNSTDTTKLKNEIIRLIGEVNEAKNLKVIIKNKDDDYKKILNDFNNSQNEIKKLEKLLNDNNDELKNVKIDFTKYQDDIKNDKIEYIKLQEELNFFKNKLSQVEAELNNANEYIKTANEVSGELKIVKAELEQQQNGNKITDDIHLKMIKLQEDNERFCQQIGKISELQKELKQVRDENDKLKIKNKHSENGVDKKIEQNNITQLEQNNLIIQKDKQLDAFKVELTKKDADFNKLNQQIEALQNDVKNQVNIITRLQEDLELQRTKNNELRTKNWKVMEALSVAESRGKTNSGKYIDDTLDKIRIAEQETTKSLLQRIFPDIEIKEKAYDRWLKTFEEHVNNILTDNNQNDDTIKQNKKLQNLVTHYKEIIADTEGMLNNLQSHVESAESRWQSELRQKENDIVNLRVELKELQSKSKATEQLQEKIGNLESRLAEQEALQKTNQFKEDNRVNDDSKNLSIIEKFNEEKQRLIQELQTERNYTATTKLELTKVEEDLKKNEHLLDQQNKSVTRLQNEIQRLKAEFPGASNNTEQLTANGPPSSDSQNSESTKKATSKRRRFTGMI
ncbi:kinectin isoform X3 [Aphidius gifuensis]|uniref:kinectin isoform X3 n=1 Tax=Aphidius gifuensis TaxID=684658 RepID=UPI001CDD080A|nr:kinectin isoform X3 [Aphidius gifuensis]